MFDSGIGGVTVLKECIKNNPNFEYFYYSDSKHNPYGDRNQDIIIGYCDKIVNILINSGCRIIIIACNTASAIAIEPAIKLAYDMSNDGTLIMATKGTMDSERFQQLYDKYHHDNFYLLSCVGLANLIETDNVDEIRKYLRDELAIYKGRVSNIVLGCTHYPLVKKYIREVLGDVTFYDGSFGVAKRLNQIIINNNFIGDGEGILFKDSTNNIEKKERFFKILESDYNG